MKTSTVIAITWLILSQSAFAIELEWQADKSIPLGKGVRLFRARQEEPPLQACYLDIDLNDPTIRVRPYLFSERITVDRVAKQNSAVAVINAGYFGGNASYSHVIVEGEIKARNLASVTREGKGYPVVRSLFYLDKHNQPDIAWVYSYDNTPNGLFAFSQPLGYGPRDPQPKTMPSRDEGKPLTNIACGIGGGPTLVSDAQKNVTCSQEVFWDSGVDCDKRHPRTAIGYTKSKHLILLVVDGRQPGQSVGISLKELAEVLKRLGCVEAMNLDGGGSTQMATPQGYINSPSEARPVPSMLAIERKAP